MPNAEQTRTLHPLDLPERLCDPGNAELRRAVFVDVETTGLGHEHDDVIELAALPFTYTLDGRVVEVLHDEAQVHRQDPGRPLPEEITHLTGLTDDDLRGERIDVEAATALIERCGLVVAHNAGFDRAFVEKALPAARRKPWACSRAEVSWTAEGFASQALHCLLCARGVYARERHRALADCEAGTWLLAQRLPVSGMTVLAAMRGRALVPTERLWAVKAPFEAKDLLRGPRLPVDAAHARGHRALVVDRACARQARGRARVALRERLPARHLLPAPRGAKSPPTSAGGPIRPAASRSTLCSCRPRGLRRPSPPPDARVRASSTPNSAAITSQGLAGPPTPPFAPGCGRASPGSHSGPGPRNDPPRNTPLACPARDPTAAAVPSGHKEPRPCNRLVPEPLQYASPELPVHRVPGWRGESGSRTSNASRPRRTTPNNHYPTSGEKPCHRTVHVTGRISDCNM